MDGDTSILNLRIPGSELGEVFHNESLVGNVEEFCAPPPAPDEDVMEGYPCSAGHTLAYISPYGDVFPCVQFPLPSGNVRRQKFIDIWRHSSELNEVRSIQRQGSCRSAPAAAMSGLARAVPGLAYMEGNMRGPSTADCEKSFHRTGIPSANMLRQERSTPLRWPADPNTVGGRLDMSRNSQFFVHEQGHDGLRRDEFESAKR